MALLYLRRMSALNGTARMLNIRLMILHCASCASDGRSGGA